MTDNVMLSNALKWLDAGFAVFPLQPRGKEPLDGSRGFKDATKDREKVKKWWSKEPTMNIGLALGAVSGGVFAFDFDIHEDADGLDALNEFELSSPLPTTLTLRTGSGGVHMLYRSTKSVRPSVNAELAVDVRGDGSYIVAPPSIHPNGNAYEIQTDAPIADADDAVYAFLEYVQPKKEWSERFELPSKVKKHDGRNNTLFRFASSLRAKMMEPEAILHALISYNAECCEPPLGKAEVRKIYNSVMHYEPGTKHDGEEQPKKKQTKRKFAHNEVAMRLIQERGACLLDDVTPAIRDGSGMYRMGWDTFDAAIIDMHDDCTDSNRREVKSYIKAVAPKRKQSPWNLIAFANGVLDVETMEFRDMRETDIIPNVIPHDWNPNAESETLYRMLERISCGDTATLMNLQEFIGICMIRSNTRMPFYPVLIGTGSNGKSTYIKLLKDVLGSENISALQPQEMAAHFMGEHIVGKLANLGDDIANAKLDGRDCGIIKRISTGENIFTDVKGTKGFYFEPYCTMVFSCNVFPQCEDTSEGFMRRLFPIEFNARFSPDDDDYDPEIGKKLRQEDALEYACKIGVEGLRRAVAQQQPTPNRMSGEVKRSIAASSNTGLQWFNDEQISRDDLIGKTKEEVYRDYSSWCERNGYARTAMSSGTLSALIGTYWHLSCTKIDHRNFTNGRKTVKVYEPKVPKGATTKPQVRGQK